MTLPAGDAQLVQILDAALAEAARCAGPWLACRPGCTQCCHGVFAINALDAERLRAGLEVLRTVDAAKAREVVERARAFVAEYAASFPGDAETGVLGRTDEDQARFEEFADDAPCPALNPSTGLCDVYAWRPMTCRVFGPPTRAEDDGALGCCELCFVGAIDAEIAACEMPVPHALEARLTEETRRSGETIVAYALLGKLPEMPR
ncbi:MAG: YkgJ family cysteine cluster protein [Acidobacteriota bacterium]|nr:YkgJ family cysteine cluster protein [Acidobacteriota bacterium]